MSQLIKQMGMYTAYHRNGVNRLIHYFMVPAIVWSIMVWSSLLTLGTFSNLEITLAMVISAALLIWYISMDYSFGIIMVAEFTILLVLAHQVADLGAAKASIIAGAVFVASWIGQLTGHAVWEKRKPALADNFVQVFIAPLFLIAEAAFAYGFKKELRAKVEEESLKHAKQA